MMKFSTSVFVSVSTYCGSLKSARRKVTREIFLLLNGSTAVKGSMVNHSPKGGLGARGYDKPRRSWEWRSPSILSMWMLNQKSGCLTPKMDG